MKSTVNRAIVKLPKTNKSMVVDTAVMTNQESNITSSTPTTVTSSTIHSSDEEDKHPYCLVSDRLYLDMLPSTVNEIDIMDHFRAYNPLKIYINRNHSIAGGYIQFVNKETADCAYTLLNGVTFKSGIKLNLKINNPLGDYPEPEAQAGKLHVKNLPKNITNKCLYELFRPFGPMTLCRIMVEQGLALNGTAIIQYFSIEQSDHAIYNMNNKLFQENTIIVSPFCPNKSRHTTDNEPTYHFTPTTNLIPSGVDFTNLYIKNLDLNVKSADLFNHFRKYGRIISARVMKNAQTKQSKGFGFVSFSKAEEAQRAKQEMTGKMILSKAVCVAYHEPKKSRDDSPGVPPTKDHQISGRPMNMMSYKPPCNNHMCRPPITPPISQYKSHVEYSTNFTTNNNVYDTHGVYHVSRPRDTEHRANDTSCTYMPPLILPSECTVLNEGILNHQCMVDRPYPGYIRNYNKPKHPQSQDQSMKRTYSGQDIPYLRTTGVNASIQPSDPIPTFRRTGSVKSLVSVMTETSSNHRKQTIMKAVMAVDKSETKSEAIADMLLTLKRKDLATCLFNQSFLKSKVKQAKEALDLFQDTPSPKEDINPVRRVRLMDKKLIADIDQFLLSMKGLATNEKKQLLGDRLFYLVKSTGVKNVSMITICLLDTIPLKELAYLMYDKESLKYQIQRIQKPVKSTL